MTVCCSLWVDDTEKPKTNALRNVVKRQQLSCILFINSKFAALFVNKVTTFHIILGILTELAFNKIIFCRLKVLGNVVSVLFVWSISVTLQIKLYCNIFRDVTIRLR